MRFIIQVRRLAVAFFFGALAPMRANALKRYLAAKFAKKMKGGNEANGVSGITLC